jgi:glucosamine-6-phosphate deaminase
MTALTPTVLPDADAVAVAAADSIAELIERSPRAAVVVATGRTPVPTYAKLADRSREGLPTRDLRVFQLDEYVGVHPDDDRSLGGWMDRIFVEPMGIAATTAVRLDGIAEDLPAACAAYDDAVKRAGGFDLAILGLGPNGHLGFNEPPSDDRSATRVVELSPRSVTSNAEYWGRELVLTHALTAGLALLLAARTVVLLVTGEAKRDILRDTVAGPVTPAVPASFLQRHPDARLFADRAAWGGSG